MNTLTAGVTCAGAGGGTPSDEKKAEAEKMLEKRADSPASSARFVGRRYRDELDSYEHDSTKHLRQHGFESPEKPCAASADEQRKDELRHEAHAVLKVTWSSLNIHKARGVRADWSDSTRPSSEQLTVFLPAPNGSRYPLVGGTREHHFAGTHFKPRNLPENAQTPTSRVHAVLGNHTERKTRLLQKNNTANLTRF